MGGGQASTRAIKRLEERAAEYARELVEAEQRLAAEVVREEQAIVEAVTGPGPQT